MVDREILATRLSKLREVLRKLQPIAAKTQDEYLASEIDRDLSEHYLRLALEATLDTGNHIIASAGFRKPLQMRDIPLILAENKVLAYPLAEKLARAAGLRNRLVHDYGTIDHTILYRILQEDLTDFETFAIAIGKYCSSNKR